MIRGIDAQIMINKSIDYAKQMSDQIHNAEQGKDFITQMERERALHETKTVNKTEHTEQERIREREQERRKEDRDTFYEEQKGVVQKEPEEDEPLAESEKGLGSEIDINI